jgi:hypothetical protein
MTQTTQPRVAPQEILLQMSTGYWLTQSLAVAARLGIADRLLDGPRSTEALSSEVQAHPEGLYRLMRALASVGVFAETAPRTYGLTALSECLLSDVPGSLRNMVMMNGNPSHYRAWGDLETAIRTNRNVFAQVFGQGVFDFLAQDPAEAEVFNGAMTDLSGMAAMAVGEAYDFTGIARLGDIGGGQGFLIRALVQRYPHLRGVLYDLPAVVAGAPAHERVEVLAGDFFKAVPAGCDAYLMKHIIHDWSDEQCVTILSHCARALPPSGKVLIVEMVVPDEPGEPFSKLADLNMLVMTDGGKERTERQFRELLAAAGLKLTRIVRTAAPVCVIEAVKA